MDTVAGEDEYPSSVSAPSALPLGFHPAGDRFLCEEPGKRFREARFTGGWSEEKKPFLGGRLAGGTATWLANGLGLVHWRPGVPGVDLVFAAKTESRRVAAEWTFATTPANVPDGRGLVGLTKEADGRQTLSFVPEEIPLGDVANAWMFVEGADDVVASCEARRALSAVRRRTAPLRLRRGAVHREHRKPPVRRHDGRLLGGLRRGVPGALHRARAGPGDPGLLGIREGRPNGPLRSRRVEALGCGLRRGRRARAEAGAATPSTGISPEAARILALKSADSPVVGPSFPYGEMKPRGNYSATPRMRSYFMAFRYLTEVARREVERLPPAERANALADLASLPPAVKAKARTWIEAYEPFIAPGRAPVVFNDQPFVPPSYASHPADGPGLFPLSFGFDNEVFLTTVFHETWPTPEQIQDPGNRRLLPSGLDLAAVTGSAFARTLLADELKRYPNLGGALDHLGEKWRRNRPSFAKSPSLYHRWLDALAVQWADEALAGAVDGKDLWRAKRLQTGLASFATLRHTTVLVNERTAAESGEGGWEEIVPKPPRGWVEADPAAFEAIAALFDAAALLVKDEQIRLDGTVPGTELSRGPRRAAPAGNPQAARRSRVEGAPLCRDGAQGARGNAALVGRLRRDHPRGARGRAQLPRLQEPRKREARHLQPRPAAEGRRRCGRRRRDRLPPDGRRQAARLGPRRPLLREARGRPRRRLRLVRGLLPLAPDDDEWRRDLDRQKRPAWVEPYVGRSADRSGRGKGDREGRRGRRAGAGLGLLLGLLLLSHLAAGVPAGSREPRRRPVLASSSSGTSSSRGRFPSRSRARADPPRVSLRSSSAGATSSSRTSRGRSGPKRPACRGKAPAFRSRPSSSTSSPAQASRLSASPTTTPATSAKTASRRRGGASPPRGSSPSTSSALPAS